MSLSNNHVICPSIVFYKIVFLFLEASWGFLVYNIKNNKILNDADSESREKRISELIDPIAQELKNLQTNVNIIEKHRLESYGRLSEQVEVLANGTRLLEQALRSPTTRGKWGEIQLQRVLELAGMSEHIDFYSQKGLDNSSISPDAIIHLPGKRALAIDSKAPLNSYIEATEAKTEKEKNKFLEQHAKNIRQTAKSVCLK